MTERKSATSAKRSSSRSSGRSSSGSSSRSSSGGSGATAGKTTARVLRDLILGNLRDDTDRTAAAAELDSIAGPRESDGE